MNGYYHILVELEENEPVIEIDIEESDLIQRIMRPWENQGNDGFYCGKTFIQKYRVRKIAILKTDVTSEHLGTNSENFQSASVSDKWRAIEKLGKDVTLRFTNHPVNPWRDKKQICLSGHIITSSYEYKPHNRKAHCDKCGKKTITECSKCHEPIPGDLYKNYYLYSGENEPPLYCEKCGKAFPWTRNKMKEYVQDRDTQIKWLEGFFSKFDLIVSRLQKRHGNRSTITVTDEYDIQDIIHPFLLVPIRRYPY